MMVEERQRKAEHLNNNLEDYESMLHIARSGYGFLGGISFLLGVYLIKMNPAGYVFAFGIVLAGVGLWLFFHGYKG